MHRVFLATLYLLPPDAWPERKEPDKGELEQHVALRATKDGTKQQGRAVGGHCIDPVSDRAGLPTQTQLQTVPCTSSCCELCCTKNLEVP